jgi:hypothetical protein
MTVSNEQTNNVLVVSSVALDMNEIVNQTIVAIRHRTQ